jgi:hypothetical protein
MKSRPWGETITQQRNDMLNDNAREPVNSKARDDRKEKSTDPRHTPDNRPTECGLTREELRALVVEMIG